MVHSPLFIPRPKAKNYILNLNVYRNTHYQTLNQMKVKYKQLVRSQIEQLPEFDKVRIAYRLYPATKRLCDIENITSVHAKFFCDALVELGKIPDDNYLHVVETRSLFGHVDKDNPRVTIYIKPVE